MSNNKQSIKVYTEEQIKEAIKIALHGFGIGGIEDTIEVVASKFTPIELPTDEEIDKEADSFFALESYNQTFTRGAKYVINKIQGGNNEV